MGIEILEERMGSDERSHFAAGFRLGAFSPFFSDQNRIANIMNGVRNMPNAPIELTRFQSANTTL